LEQWRASAVVKGGHHHIDEMAFDAELFEALFEFTHETRFGVIRGVQLDLRHRLLDPEQWTIGTLWWDRHALESGARIWFPWFGVLDRDALIDQAQSSLDNKELSGADGPPEEIVGAMLKWMLPTVVVGSGDCVSIRRVVRVLHGDEFDHLHDVESREVYLKITRPDGEIEDVQDPLLFVGTTSFIAGGRSGQITAAKIARRICAHFGIGWITDFNLVDENMFLPEAALEDAQALWRESEPLMKLLPESHDAPLGTPNRYDLRRLIDHAVSLRGAHRLAIVQDLPARAGDQLQGSPRRATERKHWQAAFEGHALRHAEGGAGLL
jgi:hypothetical protein